MEVEMRKFLVFIILLLIPLEVFAITADEVVKKSQAAFLYQGKAPFFLPPRELHLYNKRKLQGVMKPWT